LSHFIPFHSFRRYLLAIICYPPFSLPFTDIRTYPHLNALVSPRFLILGFVVCQLHWNLEYTRYLSHQPVRLSGPGLTFPLLCALCVLLLRFYPTLLQFLIASYQLISCSPSPGLLGRRPSCRAALLLRTHPCIISTIHYTTDFIPHYLLHLIHLLILLYVESYSFLPVLLVHYLRIKSRRSSLSRIADF